MKNYETFILDNESIEIFIKLFNKKCNKMPQNSGIKTIIIHDRAMPIIEPTRLGWLRAGLSFPYKSIIDEIAKYINHQIKNIEIVYQKQNIFKYKIIW